MRLRHDLHVGSPLVRVGNALVLIPQLLKRLEQRMLGALAAHRQTIRSVAGAMEGLSPLAILARGYSILQTEPDGRVVKRVRDVRPGDKVRARLTDGHVTCDIRDILPESQ
jgi:exodeoxyribonuclease VII large subunit